MFEELPKGDVWRSWAALIGAILIVSTLLVLKMHTYRTRPHMEGLTECIFYKAN